ncbi:hypothetical protein PS662_06099 [Pseudomonas fluorescens]|uniref:Uncharacterized protein n=1 Tax=Pseudomonas fluorescens TaxID=294 RepID=A0A5E6Y382_PSEFL|nr:hypothetical protein PS662_06099 [Pseudomonas fluorescens]
MKKRLRLGATNDACPVRVCGCMGLPLFMFIEVELKTGTEPVGAAAGCDLLIIKPAKIPATSYNKTTAVRLRPKAPVPKLTQC